MTEQANKPDYPEMDDEQLEEDLANEVISKSKYLTVYQAEVLLAALAQVNNGIWEPLMFMPWEEISLTEAPLLDEEQLLEMAQAQALVRVGYITMKKGYWELTPWGALIAQYLAASLYEQIQATDWPITPILKKTQT